MKPIIYIQKSYGTPPTIFQQLRWMMSARDKGETYNPMRCRRDKGLRTAFFTITWEMLTTDLPLPVYSWPYRTPIPMTNIPDKVSTRDGKPIGWNIKR